MTKDFEIALRNFNGTLEKIDAILEKDAARCRKK